MRVLFVESMTEFGGAQTALLHMLKGLDRDAVDPLFASLEFGNGSMPEEVARLEIPVFRLQRGRFRNLMRTAEKVAALCGLIRAHNIDLVMSNSGHPLLFARPAAVVTQRPCVWWVHGYFPWDPLRGHFIHVVQQQFAADAIFTVSADTARVMRLDYPEYPPIRVVRCGVPLGTHFPNPEKGRAARHALGIAPGESVVGIFGRLQPWKGQHVFLQAAAELVKRGVPCRFVVVGGSLFGLDLDYAERLRRYVMDAGLSKCVQFLGHRNDTNDLMNACDVVVQSSVEPEPGSLVVMETMAAGRPLVATAAGGTLERVEHGKNGLLFRLGDAHELADQVQALLRDPERRRRLGEAARRFAQEHLDPRKAAGVLCAELRRVHTEYAARN